MKVEHIPNYKIKKKNQKFRTEILWKSTKKWNFKKQPKLISQKTELKS